MRRSVIDRNKEFGTQVQAMNDNFTALYGEVQRMGVQINNLKVLIDSNKKNIEAMTRFFGDGQP
jgi:hypothetical protein